MNLILPWRARMKRNGTSNRSVTYNSAAGSQAAEAVARR